MLNLQVVRESHPHKGKKRGHQQVDEEAKKKMEKGEPLQKRGQQQQHQQPSRPDKGKGLVAKKPRLANADVGGDRHNIDAKNLTIDGKVVDALHQQQKKQQTLRPDKGKGFAVKTPRLANADVIEGDHHYNISKTNDDGKGDYFRNVTEMSLRLDAKNLKTARKVVDALLQRQLARMDKGKGLDAKMFRLAFRGDDNFCKVTEMVLRLNAKNLKIAHKVIDGLLFRQENRDQ